MKRRAFLAALVAAPVAAKAAPLLATQGGPGPLLVHWYDADVTYCWHPIPDAPGSWIDESGRVAHLGFEDDWK